MVFLFCQATDADDKQMKGIKMGVLTVLDDDDDDAVINIALVLEETIVLKDIPDTPTALAYFLACFIPSTWSSQKTSGIPLKLSSTFSWKCPPIAHSVSGASRPSC